MEENVNGCFFSEHPTVPLPVVLWGDLGVR